MALLPLPVCVNPDKNIHQPGNPMSLSIRQITAKDVSLGEFLKCLVFDLQRRKVQMPFQNEEKWHQIFFNLKSANDQKGRPAFFDKLRFDWDGPYPRCQDLSEYLQTLHLNGFVSVSNPSYDRLNVDDDVLKEEKSVRPIIKDSTLKKFFAYSTKQALALF